MNPTNFVLYRTPCQSCRTVEKMSGSPTGSERPLRLCFTSHPNDCRSILATDRCGINSPVAVSRETLDPFSVILGPAGIFSGCSQLMWAHSHLIWAEQPAILK